MRRTLSGTHALSTEVKSFCALDRAVASRTAALVGRLDTGGLARAPSRSDVMAQLIDVAYFLGPLHVLAWALQCSALTVDNVSTDRFRVIRLEESEHA